MKRYTFNLEYLYSKLITVDAESEEEAYDLISDMVMDEEVQMTEEDFQQFELFIQDEEGEEVPHYKYF